MRRPESDSGYVDRMEQPRRTKKPRSDQRGERMVVTMRMPLELKDKLERLRDKDAGSDMPLGSWLVYELCRAEGLEAPQFVVDDREAALRRREELPLLIA